MARNKGKRPSGAGRSAPEKDQKEVKPTNGGDRPETKPAGEHDAAKEAKPAAGDTPLERKDEGPDPEAAGADPHAGPEVTKTTSTAAGAGAAAMSDAGTAAAATERSKTEASRTPSAGGTAPKGQAGEKGQAGGAGEKRSGGAATPPPPPSGRSGGVSGGGAWFRGLIGGVIGGVAAWAVLTYGVDTPTPRLDAVTVQTNRLDERLGELESETAEFAEVMQRIETLEEDAPGDDALIGRLDELEAALAEFQGDTAIGDLAARVEALEGRPAAGGEVEPRLDALAERLDRMETRLQEAGEQTDVTGLRDRLVTLESDLASLSARLAEGAAGAEGELPSGPDADVAGSLAALETRVGDLAARVSEIESSAGDAQQMADLGERVTTLESATGERADELQAQIDALTQQLPDADGLTGSLEDLAQKTETQGDRIAALADDVEELNGAVGEVRQSTQSLGDSLDQLSGRVGELEGRIDAAESAQERAAALAVVTNQLSSALTGAEPFDDLLEPLRSLAGEDGVVTEAVSALEPVAASGVPTLAALRNEFEQIAGEIVHKARAPEGEGLLDQATDNLMRLVTVRPVGADVEGDDPAALVARAEARLGDGDLARAVAELEKLDGAAASAAEPWLERARARLRAEAALSDLQRHAAGLLAQNP